MQTDNDLEQRLRDALRQALDREGGPDPTWDESPAARRVAEGDRRRPGRWTLRVLLVAAVLAIGGSTVLLLGSPDDPPPVDPASNGWIAQSSGGDIYFLTPDQEVSRVIGTDGDGVSEGCPAFSPDGRHLAYGRVAGEATWDSGTDGVQEPSFATYRDSALVIGDVADDGHVTGQMTIDIGDGQPPPCPVWSPTGERIAFAVPRTPTGNPTQSAEDSEVWIVTVADRGITVLPNLLATDLEFSPDGSLLGVTSGTEAPPVYGAGLPDGRVYLYDLTSGSTRTLETTEGAVAFSWSPDGERIAYETGDLNHELRLIDLATEEVRPLAAPFMANHGIGPVWSPDGESIVYQRRVGSGERHNVVLVWPDDLSADDYPREEAFTLFDRSADGSERALYPRWLTWSPDGEYLLFSGWPAGGFELLGVTPSVPGRPSDILVSNDGGVVADEPYVFFEPFMPIQTWGRMPSD